METQPVVVVFHEDTGLLQIEVQRGDKREIMWLKLSDLQVWEFVERAVRRLRYLASQ